MIIQVCLGVIFGLFLTWICFKRSKKYEWLEQFPGPTPNLPFVGNGHQFLGNPSDVDGTFQENFRKFGTVWKLWILHKPTLVTSDPILIQKILASNTHLDKHFLYEDVLGKVMGPNGLLTSKGYNINLTPKEIETAHSNIHIALELLNTMLLKPWTSNPLWQKLFGIETLLKGFHSQTRLILQKAIERMGEFKGKESSPVLNDTKSASTVKDILSDKTIPFDWKHDQFINISGAGVDTSAVTQTMTLFFLACYPACQKKAQEEIDLLFNASSKESISLSDIMGLKYLKMCMKESMRLHSPGALIGRTTGEAIQMDDGRIIPAGSAVLISMRQLHIDPNVYSCPETFDPERFSDESVVSMKPNTYIPFSSGPRNCVGYKFAETVVLTTLALILREFSVKTLQRPEDIKILYEVAGTPYPNIELMFERRTDVPNSDP